MMKSVLMAVVAACVAFSAAAGVSVSNKAVRGRASFVLANRGNVAAVVYDEADALVVERVAGMFADDMQAVTGIRPEVLKYGSRLPYRAVITGTAGTPMVERLVKAGKLDVSSIEGGWERYIIKVVTNPLPGVGEALVVVGSDRRGTAYGLLEISEKAGVNPWYWWADAPVAKASRLVVSTDGVASKEPSVRYRGIFINDEDWGMTPWAAKTFEPEVGNIGPRTYSKVCELLLRLKANYLCPAMHEVSHEFARHPENKFVADTFAIVMGSTHCEPLLFNTAREWDSGTMGQWNYDTNKDKILEVLDKRVKENCRFENVYTLALRGLHDGAMQGGADMKQRVQMLQSALMDQRDILAKNIDRPIETVPQAFTPYKEVLDIYSRGVEMPDDITIVWPDDNFGYMKRLSNPHEQKRSGRSGVYYHVSYLGVPHSYLWFSTTPPSLMYEELRKAYDTTADRLWLCNCGDLKACEMQVSLFLDMAWDIDAFDASNVVHYPAQWLSRMFGEDLYEEFDARYREYLALAFPRKPEYMGWGYHWNHWSQSDEQRTDTQMSFSNYSEAQSRLERYKALGRWAENKLSELPEDAGAAFYQLVYYPFKGAELMNRMHLGGQLNRQYAREGRAATSSVASEVRQVYDSLNVITKGYNSLLGGKWNHMMSLRQNYDHVSSYYKIPNLVMFRLVDKPMPCIKTEGEVPGSESAYHVLPPFDAFMRQSRWFEIYNKGAQAFSYELSCSENWVRLSKVSGECSLQEKIEVTIDWDAVPAGVSKAAVTVKAGEWSDNVLLSVKKPQTPTVEELKGIYVESDGVVSIPAAGYTRVRSNDNVKISVVPDLGIEGDALLLGSPVAPVQAYRDDNTPTVEYDFYCFGAGLIDVYSYVLPTFVLHSEHDMHTPENTNAETRYSVQIDGGALQSPTTSDQEYSRAWYEAVQMNCRINKVQLYVDRPGRHTLKIRVGDPGLVVQKIVMDFGGLCQSYTGPGSTLVK